MATRALIGHLSDDGRKMISTYNHYDGYPESLGKALSKFYNSPEKAKEIANFGYISYLNSDTGEIDSKYNEDADLTPLEGEFTEDDAYEIAEKIDSYGADYAYIWLDDNWITIKNNGIQNTASDLLAKFYPTIGETMKDIEETYETKWQKFINEENMNMPLSKVISQAIFKLQDEPKQMVDAYKKSLANSIRLNGKEQYEDFSVEDFIEDYENYIADKMDM